EQVGCEAPAVPDSGGPYAHDEVQDGRYDEVAENGHCRQGQGDIPAQRPPQDAGEHRLWQRQVAGEQRGQGHGDAAAPDCPDRAHEPGRYLDPGIVWITGGWPSLRRSVMIATRTAFVNGSAFSSHAFSSSSSALTIVLSARISISSTANSLGASSSSSSSRQA